MRLRFCRPSGYSIVDKAKVSVNVAKNLMMRMMSNRIQARCRVERIVEIAGGVNDERRERMKEQIQLSARNLKCLDVLLLVVG